MALSYHDVRVQLKTRTINECTAVIYKQDGIWNLSDKAPLNKNTGTALVNSDLKIKLMVTSGENELRARIPPPVRMPHRPPRRSSASMCPISPFEPACIACC